MIEIIERSSIETKSFELNYSNNPDLVKSSENEGRTIPEKSDADVEKNKEDLGKYPVIWINGVQVESPNITKLTLNNDGFMPYLSLEFSDPTNKLIDDNFPVDNAIVSIFKESSNKDLMAIKMDFKITDFSIIKGTSKETVTYTIDAIVDVDGFYLNNFESYKGTSFDVLKKLSQDLKLGFATNISSTNDQMVWINPSNYRIEFFSDIVERSYIDDDTFLFGYVDFYYNFNYVDIEKQLKDDISEQMNMLDRETKVKDGKDDNVPLILSNNPDYTSDSNIKINKYTIINSSTAINLEYGYRNQLFYYNKLNDEVSSYMLDNITEDNGNSIVMKGDEGGNNILYNDMVSNTWFGKQDDDNVHNNYLHSLLQNKNNLKFLQKIKMKVKLEKINYGLYRFQKVLVELYNMGKSTDSKDADKSKEKMEGVGQHDDKIIHKLSGEWLITSINMVFSKDDGVIQELTLVKRELTKEYTFPRRPKSNN